jgi:NCS1 family nucleobase:cation symporter-1
MVGFWATLSLNIPDFTRFARSQRDQIWGQAIGLPLPMALFAFIGVAVTGATIVVFGSAIWDPVDLLGRFRSPWVIGTALVALAVATLTTNIAANVIAPANAFCNLAPGWISLRTGGILSAILGVLFMPWKLLADPQGYVFTWLVGYSALLGPIAGIMIADFYLVRRGELVLNDLFHEGGRYGLWNWRAIWILFASILPNLPGFLDVAGYVKRDRFVTLFSGWAAKGTDLNQNLEWLLNGTVELYPYAWFVGFFLAFVLQGLLGRRNPATA